MKPDIEKMRKQLKRLSHIENSPARKDYKDHIYYRCLALCDYADTVTAQLDEKQTAINGLKAQLSQADRENAHINKMFAENPLCLEIVKLKAQLDEKDKTIKRLNEYTNDKIARHVEARFKNNETFPETVTAQLDESHRNLGTVCEQLEEAQKEIERLKDA